MTDFKKPVFSKNMKFQFYIQFIVQENVIIHTRIFFDLQGIAIKDTGIKYRRKFFSIPAHGLRHIEVCVRL